ncbi:MAG: energy transducer TonB [Deltaproteobacteria bacterium]|nr:energy transducer TonB [Deltaproteobacteria bacterium]
MKRLLPAFLAAIGLHALFFNTKADWAKTNAIPKVRHRSITFDLVVRQPQDSVAPQKSPDIIKRFFIPKKEIRPKPSPPISPEKIKRISVQKKKKRVAKKIKKAKKSRLRQVPEKTKPVTPKPKPKPSKTRNPPFAEKDTLPNLNGDSENQPFSETPAREMVREPIDVASLPVEEKGPSGPTPDTAKKTSAQKPLPLVEAVPDYKKNPKPKYPRIARRRGYEGTVVIEVLVDREGKVEDLKLFQSSGHQVLDKAATTSVRRWVFEPGKKGNEHVAMWVKVPVRFRLR